MDGHGHVMLLNVLWQQKRY